MAAVQHVERHVRAPTVPCLWTMTCGDGSQPSHHRRQAEAARSLEDVDASDFGALPAFTEEVEAGRPELSPALLLSAEAEPDVLRPSASPPLRDEASLLPEDPLAARLLLA
jgi:hypothetical protein